MKLLTTTLALLCALFATAQLSGNYTIDGSEKTKKTNFNTITDATNALKFQGIEGDVVFEIAANTYYGPVVLENINEDGDYKVSFKASSDKKVIFENDGIALMIVGSNNISFENISFESISSASNSIIQLDNSNGIVINECDIVTKDISNKDNFLVNINNTSSNNVISNNMLVGYNGVLVSKMSNNNTVEANHIFFDQTGVEVQSSQNLNLFGNTLKGNKGIGKTGIVIDGFVGNMEIASNAISNTSVGMSQKLTWRPSEHKLSGKIINNVFSCKESAVYLTNNIADLKIDFNSFSAENGSVVVITEEIKNTISNIEMMANNLVSNNGFMVVNIANKDLLLNVDYNNIFCENKDFKVVVGKETFNSLEEWKVAMDAENSISADPMYVEVGNSKYLVAEDSPCINAGPNAENIGVVTDYDGDLRGEVTEIGADEFNKLALEEAKMAVEYASVK